MASEHIIKSYDEELRKLSNMITEWRARREQLATAIDAVIKRDSELAASVVEGDAKVDHCSAISTISRSGFSPYDNRWRAICARSSQH